MINMLLENNLPPSVADLPRDMPAPTPKRAEEQQDVNAFGHAVAPMPALDVSRLHRGKKLVLLARHCPLLNPTPPHIGLSSWRRTQQSVWRKRRIWSAATARWWMWLW